MKIVLHIGTEKTATTSIQTNLYENRQVFADKGVLYPTRLLGENHLCLPACAAGDPSMDEITANAYRFIAKAGYDDMDRYVVETLTAQIKAVNPDLIILSNEHLHSRIRNRELIKRLANTLRKITRDIEVVVYLRRQDRLAVSFFSTPFKYGKQTVENAIPTATGALPHYYDYGKMVAMWADVFGRDNVVVKIFEEEARAPGGMMASFLDTAGIAMPPDLKVENHNESLSLEAVHFLAGFNRAVAELPAERADQVRRMRRALVGFLEKNHPSRRRPASKDMARRFYDACRPTNELVRRSFFPHRGLLFDENFDEYGGDERLSPDPQTIVEIGASVALWQMSLGDAATARAKQPEALAQ